MFKFNFTSPKDVFKSKKLLKMSISDNISKTKLISDLGHTYSSFKPTFTSTKAVFKAKNCEKCGF